MIRFVSCEPLIGPLSLRNVLGSGGIHWVIVGGESGPGRRPMDGRWVRNLRDECLAARVPFFFKQWGGRTPKAWGREVEGREWNEMLVRAGGRADGLQAPGLHRSDKAQRAVAGTAV